MKFPNDIISILRKLLVCNKIKECNNEYKGSFKTTEERNFYVSLLYKTKYYRINNRNLMWRQDTIIARLLRLPVYRVEIACFLTGKLTEYKIPKNY